MEAPLSLALAIYPPFYAALFARSLSSLRLVRPFLPQTLTSLAHPLSLLLGTLVSRLFCSFLPALASSPSPRRSASPWLSSARPPRLARFFSSASDGIPEGIPTFLTAATAFIPSSSSPGRAYKGSPESNKSDNARGRETRECTHKSDPDNHSPWYY